MARANNNPLLQGVSRKKATNLLSSSTAIGTVISAMPDMSRVKRSMLQKMAQQKFAEAVHYARSISRNPVKKEAYAKKLKKGRSVYHAAIQEYYKKHKF